MFTEPTPAMTVCLQGEVTPEDSGAKVSNHAL